MNSTVYQTISALLPDNFAIIFLFAAVYGLLLIATWKISGWKHAFDINEQKKRERGGEEWASGGAYFRASLPIEPTLDEIECLLRSKVMLKTLTPQQRNVLDDCIKAKRDAIAMQGEEHKLDTLTLP